MKIAICLTDDTTLSFEGKYLREKETENWHYYLVDDWALHSKTNCPCILHIRKDQLRYVITEGGEL